MRGSSSLCKRFSRHEKQTRQKKRHLTFKCNMFLLFKWIIYSLFQSSEILGSFLNLSCLSRLSSAKFRPSRMALRSSSSNLLGVCDPLGPPGCCILLSERGTKMNQRRRKSPCQIEADTSHEGRSAPVSKRPLQDDSIISTRSRKVF